ncbi:MAG: oligosaccharide flippase family protein [Butyrivibrio sp.]|nr:oligosaccharide flippase family protein [Butyrivibrio sp.]
MSREGKFAKNTVILALGTFFPKLAIFITLPILTACLTKEEYGTYDLMVTMVSLILPAATLQIQSAAFRFLIDVREDEKEKENIITNIYIFVIATSTIALFVMYFVLTKYTWSTRLIICLYFLFDIISNTNKQIVRGLSDNKSYAVGCCIGGLSQILFVLFLVYALRKGLIGGILGLCAAELLCSSYLFVHAKLYKYIRRRAVSTKQINSMLAYSWPMVPNGLSQWVMHVSDRLVITFFMGPSSNAVYAVAYKIPSILAFAQVTFNMAWQENASIVLNDDDAAQYYSTMFMRLFKTVTGCMAGLIGISPLLFRIFIRGDYTEAYNQIPILYMGILFYCLSAFWGGIYVAFKKTKAVGITTIAAAASNLIIDIVTIRWIGLYAASLSTLISYIALCVFRMVGVQKIIKLTYDFKQIILILIIMIGQCVLSFMQNTVCNVINFVIGIIVCIYLNKELLGVLVKRIKKHIGGKT